MCCRVLQGISPMAYTSNWRLANPAQRPQLGAGLFRIRVNAIQADILSGHRLTPWQSITLNSIPRNSLMILISR